MVLITVIITINVSKLPPDNTLKKKCLIFTPNSFIEYLIVKETNPLNAYYCIHC